jgi:uncharacterized protein (TIGR00375 family)
MNLIVDLHIHSHYSRATSKNSTVEGLYKWGKIKGINVIGSGDFTHPEWFRELHDKLEPAEGGLFRLREDIATELDKELPASVRNNLMRYMLTVEISNIYSKHGSVRKLHNVIIVPSFEVASEMVAQLDRIGNLKADGRPILGVDSKELLRMTVESHPDSLFIPAHIWTPWFAMFGSKSGFDSIEEAFEELAPEIKAIETGLSSDPFMNWRLTQLDPVTIVSNSDAHSPQKLGREATVIDCDLSYKEIIDAIKTNDDRLVGTVEFFPQEGKYHFDGHRLCGVRMSPQETKQHNGICPKCGKPMVVGVDYRVDEIADRPESYKPQAHKQVEYIIPLPEIIAEIKGVSASSKKVSREYEQVYSTLGDEFSILRSVPTEEIKRSGFAELAPLIERMRKGDVQIEPGYDGVYGVIKLISQQSERIELTDQMSLGI